VDDALVIGGQRIANRLFLGTGKFANNHLIPEAVKASGARVVTVALRRIDFDHTEEDVASHVPKDCILMPNTSGARNAAEAVRLARIARAAGCGDWIKIEVIDDQKYLLPDNQETLKATEVLVAEGFVVLPYISPDLTIARQLERAGAAAVMPLGSPIGSNRGLRTEELLRILIAEIGVPVIVDAGLGRPSEAACAMEMGAAAVLVNTAIATAGDPVSMARAFGQAVAAGRTAFLAGLAQTSDTARASSPLTGFLYD